MKLVFKILSIATISAVTATSCLADQTVTTIENEIRGAAIALQTNSMTCAEVQSGLEGTQEKLASISIEQSESDRIQENLSGAMLLATTCVELGGKFGRKVVLQASLKQTFEALKNADEV